MADNDLSPGTQRQRNPVQTKLPLPTVIAHARQIAEVLDKAHGQQRLYLNLQPEHIHMGREGNLWLSPPQPTTRTSTTNGADATRLPYMAPEELQGLPCAASDQYALATIVYEWLCGRLPFSGTAREIAVHKIADEPQPLRGFVPIPPEVEEVVMRALAKEPNRRFPSAGAFVAALGRAYEADQQAQSARTFVRPPVVSAPPPPPVETTLHHTRIVEPPYPNTTAPPPPPLDPYTQRSGASGPYYLTTQPTQPRSPAQPYLPLIRGKAQLWDIPLILGYSLLIALTTAPLGGSSAATWHIALWILVILPAGTLLAGKVFGGWRSIAYMACFTIVIVAVAEIYDLSVPGASSTKNTTSPWIFLPLLGLPLATWLMGWIYSRQSTNGCLLSGWTTVLGSFIVAASLLSAIVLDKPSTFAGTVISPTSMYILLVFLYALTLMAVMLALEWIVYGLVRLIWGVVKANK